MTSDEILNKAKYIQFPLVNNSYREDYKDYIDNIYRLPIITDENVLYNSLSGDEHHYTTHYCIKYVIPSIDKLLNFGFNINDFKLKQYYIKENNIKSNLSYLVPKKEYTFKLYSFLRNKEFDFSYDGGLVLNFNLRPEGKYRDLFVFPHQCSKIINNELQNNKKLFISGDSQIIPCISILACYYKEVWYFDNRTGKKNNIIDENKTIKYSDKYKDTIFDDVLIELYSNPLEWYTKINLM